MLWLSGINVSRAQAGMSLQTLWFLQSLQRLIEIFFKVHQSFIAVPWYWFNLTLSWFWKFSPFHNCELAQSSRTSRLSVSDFSREVRSRSIKDTQRVSLRKNGSEKTKSAPSRSNKGTDSWHVSEKRAKLAAHNRHSQVIRVYCTLMADGDESFAGRFFPCGCLLFYPQGI